MPATLLAVAALALIISPAARLLNYGLLGSALIACAAPKRRVPITSAVVLGLGLAFVRAQGSPAALSTLLAQAGMPFGFLGLGALAALAARGDPDGATLVGALGIPLGILLVLVAFLAGLMPRSGPTFDWRLMRLDRGLGFAPSYLVARRLLAVPIASSLMRALYHALGFEMAVVYSAAQHQVLAQRAWRRVLAAVLAIAVIGPVLYLLCPATGPLYAFAGFPWAEPDATRAAATAVPPDAARNAMPSLHLAWTLVIYRGVSGSARWLRAVTLLWLGGTVVATLGLGEHYAADLVAAVPFALTVERLVAGCIDARTALGLAFTGVWILLPRMPWAPNGLLTWTLMVSTVAAALAVVGTEPARVHAPHSQRAAA
ncbi:MAG TPA: phosphatase PAP2 family protein [Gemmatimonadales bacterium]|nr:phosphatase PAP2 family protein [Gemmatimonadales bacterium]